MVVCEPGVVVVVCYSREMEGVGYGRFHGG